MTLDERIEAAAAALLANDDDLPPDHEWARQFMASKVGHAGDCPHAEKREPYSCVACTREDMTRRARALLAHAFPEFFSSPPTHWIAPMEATEEMLHVGFLTDERMGCEKAPGSSWRPLNEPAEVITQVFEDMRDVYLNREGK